MVYVPWNKFCIWILLPLPDPHQTLIQGDKAYLSLAQLSPSLYQREMLQMRSSGSCCSWLLWHIPWAGQAVPLRQAEHPLWYHLRHLRCCLVLHQAWALSYLDTFQVLYYRTNMGQTCITLLLCFSATIEAPQMVEMFPAYYIFNGLLSVLLVLHVIWTYFILKIAFHAVLAKKVESHLTW